MSYVDLITDDNPKVQPKAMSYPIVIYTEVSMSEYWNLLGIPFIQERFMKYSIIYVKTVTELIEASKYANLHLLHLLDNFKSGAIQAYIISKEEPVLYK
jgi:hypothetical protein